MTSTEGLAPQDVFGQTLREANRDVPHPLPSCFCCGAVHKVVSYRTQRDTPQGTVWRLILDDKKRTIIIVPYQSPHRPAPSLHRIPDSITAVLAGPNHHGDFSSVVHDVASTDVLDPGSMDLRDQLQQEFIAGEAALRAATCKKSAQITPRNESARIMQFMVEKAAELDAATLAALRRSLAAHGVSGVRAEVLHHIVDFIRQYIQPNLNADPEAWDSDLRRVIRKVNELTGVDIIERVYLAFNPQMKPFFDSLVNETAKAESIQTEEARRQIIDRGRFIAVFPDGDFCLVHSESVGLPDAEDMALFTRDSARASADASSLQLAKPQNTVPSPAVAPRTSAK